MASPQQEPQPVARRLVTVHEAAKVLGVSVSHLYNLAAKGQLAGVVKLGRSIRINLDALLDKGVA